MIAGLRADKVRVSSERTYRLDFDETRTLFILTPAAWPIGRDGGCILTRSHVFRRWPEGAHGRRYIGIPQPKRISNAYVSSLQLFRPFRLLGAHVFRSVYFRSSLVRPLADATRSIASVGGVIDVLPAKECETSLTEWGITRDENALYPGILLIQRALDVHAFLFKLFLRYCRKTHTNFTKY